MNPKVSVCVVTYNHEKYIRQCLQSIVDQTIDFELEVIVSDDCSGDKTREIIAEFANLYPNIIKPVYLDKNIGAFKNFIVTHNSAAGDFVCHCDGDDYFLPGKLQKQFNYFLAHQDCSVVWHRVKIQEENRFYLLGNFSDFLPDGRVDTAALLRMNCVGAHSSIMYRRSSRKTKNDSLLLLDFYYALEFLQSGYGYLMDDILGVYRRDPQSGSMTSTTAGYIRVKRLLAQHYSDFFDQHQGYRSDVFVGVLFNFFYDALNFRTCSWNFLKIVIRSFDLFSVLDVFKVLRIKMTTSKKYELIDAE